MVYLIYGKRKNIDKTFRALDSNGVRVNKLADAMAYATKEDAQEILDRPNIKEKIESGQLEFEIRRG